MTIVNDNHKYFGSLLKKNYRIKFGTQIFFIGDKKIHRQYLEETKLFN